MLLVSTQKSIMYSLLQVALVIAILCWAPGGLAQRPSSKTCSSANLEACPSTSDFKTVTIANDSTHLYVFTSMCPPYDNPRWTNPSEACIFDNWYSIPLSPRFARKPIPVGEPDVRYENILYLKEDPAPILGVMGVLKNGVNVFGVGSPCGYSSKCPENGGPTKYVDAVESEGHTVDPCGGHAAPTHQYHIHSGVGMNTSEERKACNLPADIEGEHSEQLGWMFDGFGLYGRFSDKGLLPTDLDKCEGHSHAINGIGDSIYHYHIPDTFPWIIGCYTGCPEISNNPREFGYLRNDTSYGCQ